MKKLLVLLIFAVSGFAQAQRCEQPGPSSGLGQRLAELAMGEYHQFNGHRIDAQGRLWKFGSVETETEPLRDAEPADRFAWRRVWRYWQTLDRHVPGTMDFRRVTWAPELLDDPANSPHGRQTTLRDIFAKLPPDLDATEAEILRESVVRATISDTPWSAAFISYLMDRAGLSEEQFRYASAHAVYIRPALEGREDYAYRACDVRKTAPRVGDLICYGRAARPLKSFADWLTQTSELDSRVKSHCDIVVKVDRPAAKIETIGGNVEQSVTWRKLMLDERGVLSSRHLMALHPKPRGPNATACASDGSCEKSDLNLQYWGVLLQLR